MSTLPPCPQCQSEYTYEDGAQLVCPECGHEWSAEAPDRDGQSVTIDRAYIDAHLGELVQDPDLSRYIL